jgi:cbb3-type cytochrome c oxidase subunit III
MWGVVACLVAVAACAKKNNDEAAATDTTSAAPAAAPAPAPVPTAAALPAGATQEMVTQGDQIFHSNGNCYTCHGADAKGTALAPDLTDAKWINVGGTYDEIQSTVKKGVPQPKEHPGPMPPMGGAQLTDDQVKAVAAYVWSLGGGKS